MLQGNFLVLMAITRTQIGMQITGTQMEMEITGTPMGLMVEVSLFMMVEVSLLVVSKMVVHRNLGLGILRLDHILYQSVKFALKEIILPLIAGKGQLILALWDTLSNAKFVGRKGIVL